MCLQFEIVCARSGQALSPSPFASVTDWMQPSIPLKRCGADALSSNTIAQQHYSGLQGCNPTEKMHYLSWPRSRTHPQPIEELRPLPMVMSYGPSNRIFPSFYRIFPGEFEGKIQLAHTPIRHRAAFMRIETEGVATEHRWLDELQRSPFAKLVFRETTGTKFDKPSFEDSVPACVVTPLRAGYEAAYVKSWPIVLFISSGPYACAARRRLGCRPGGKRAKAVFDLENGSGTLDDILYKQTGAFIISTWSDELPNVQAQEARTDPCAFSALSSKNFSVRVSTGTARFITVDLLLE